MSEPTIEQAESVVAGEVLAMQVNPTFDDLCVISTFRIQGLIAMVEEFNEVVSDVQRILDESDLLDE